MALKFVMFAFLAVVASGLDDSFDISDQTSFLQTSMVVESRKAQRESSSSFGEALATCPSLSASDMDGTSCTSTASGVHIKSMQTPKTVKAHEPVKAVAVEDQSEKTEATQSDSSREATISFLRCILNFVTFLFVIDILRRSLCTNGSGHLEKVVSVDAEDTVGRTALHVAAKTGDAAVVDTLLQRGAKVDATDTWDETALHHAARAGAIDICKSLLAAGAKIDALNAQDWTPLVAAASRGQKDTCEWLIAHGATQDSLPEAKLPSLLQQLLKVAEPDMPEPDFTLPSLEAKQEADLLRRALEPKPEWEAESLPEWVAAIDDYDA